ncbi:glycoside hydrolase family 31 protein [Phlebiopsis gigantea 11061_1 CR5-6]|uniref:Glycoside hydrolase family 31 protein n=1 Tax=Phlebiopsis gigantea (strain 11061_1 CR5-6) TaxID=745531 RepID=A0A0C3NFN1_PHLG1|nr:glycoside hydrolase family 31 protein [Phlebiopsis gigantea 11061_1 CR5-6]
MPRYGSQQSLSCHLYTHTTTGYVVSSVQETKTGLIARLSLAGPSCNAFGLDVEDLALEVDYESDSRLHVNIYDVEGQQFTIPRSVIDVPEPTANTHTSSSDLVFNYDSTPFAFWITRRFEPSEPPLFDTRTASLPPTPIPPIDTADPSTGLDGFPLVFEDQFLQFTSALPRGTNIYGLGEVVASSGIRRNIDGDGTIQTMWARDAASPIDENIYGSHPIYMEHRFSAAANRHRSHGVFLLSAAGSDTLLLTPPDADISLIQYRLVGGALDFYFFSGPTPQKVVEQYGELIGTPAWQPAWAFGFHLCRWGYANIEETREQVRKMREANVPLEVMWNDIDLYHAVRDFTADPVSFPPEKVRSFIRELAENHQHYVPILDAAIPKQTNTTDVVRNSYDPYTRGVDLDIFIKNTDGTEHIGQVWPGYTVFPDFFAENIKQYWTEALRNWSALGVEYSGIWLDMNEAASFCEGSCGTGANISNTSVPFILPGRPGNLIVDYPEGYELYNPSKWGPSGNITINGTFTYELPEDSSVVSGKRSIPGGEGYTSRATRTVDAATPPYAIHNGQGLLSAGTIAANATHAGGQLEIDVHNLWGLMEERATYDSLLEINPGKRPFIISRSTFASSGRWTGHWLGDNFSKWSYMYLSIQGMLQFQLFQIPFVGPDTCGFIGNADEELCNRWMQLGAFMPFFRNHNILGAIPQEPYVWDSVAEASRTAIAVRYSLLPYWYTLFANSSRFGSPPIRPLFWEFPDEPELFSVDRQFLLGRELLITPVLTPNVSAVNGIFPGRGEVAWRDFYTHEVLSTTSGGQTALSAPLGHIPVHVREGAAILMHARPGYTTAETRTSPFRLLVFATADGYASGHAYFDDGESLPPTAHRDVLFFVSEGKMVVESSGSFDVEPRLESLVVLGVKRPSTVMVQGGRADGWSYTDGLQKLVLSDLNVDLNGRATIEWSY